MSLKTSLRNAVKAAFKALDDVPRKVTYKSVSGAPVRDFDSGTSSLTTTDYPLPMVVFTRFKERESDKDPALLTDQKLLIPAMDLPVLPKASDVVIDDAGVVWEVIQRLSDPAAVLITLQVRTS